MKPLDDGYALPRLFASSLTDHCEEMHHRSIEDRGDCIGNLGSGGQATAKYLGDLSRYLLSHTGISLSRRRMDSALPSTECRIEPG